MLHYDPDDALISFLNIFTDLLNKHAPIINKRVKMLRQNEWMNTEIKNAMNSRDFYHKKQDTQNFKFWRNKVKYLIESSKQNYFSSMIEQNKSNSSKLWKHLHLVSGSNKHSDISIMNDTDKSHVTGAKNIADLFNDYFSNIAEKLNINQESNNCSFDKLDDFVSSHIPDDIHFSLPLMTEEFVSIAIGIP